MMCLLLTSLLMVMGLGFLAQHSSSRQSVGRQLLSSQAKEIARAGLEDARLKYSLDWNFPPPGTDVNTPYVYSENVYDTDQSTILGYYTVTLDSSLIAPPYQILRLTSVGVLGNHGSNTAYRRIDAEIDTSPQARSNPANPNPRLGTLINYREDGGL